MLLNEQQLNNLTEQVNKEVDIPVIGEKPERAVLKLAIKKIVTVLDEELPPELKDPINQLDEGVDFDGQGDLQQLADNTADFLNKEINLPLVDEKGEQELYHCVVTILFEAMQEQEKI